MKSIRSVAAPVLLASLATAPLTGCSREGWELAGDLAAIAVATAVYVAVLSDHDAHYHSAYCGHQHAYVDHHPVYYYEGRWEYYDGNRGRWYYYPDGVRGY